ncbi:MAG TPA: hypothetical protein DCW60_00075 [Sutterella sp.]|nr:hypothetical protein [Sutterella sp.]
MAFESWRNYFLIATPCMIDPTFCGAVVYLCEHNENGAMGFVINHPLPPGLERSYTEDMVRHLGQRAKTVRLFEGGPLGLDGVYILHRPQEIFSSAVTLAPNVMLSMSKIDFEKIFTQKEEKDYLVITGYCSWGAGQLERELEGPDWLLAPFDEKLIFDVDPMSRLEAALASIGLTENQLSTLSNEAHA